MKNKSLLILLALILVFVMSLGVGCHTHQYGEWQLTTDPTETTTGVAVRTCETCGGTETKDDVPALSDTETWTMKETPATHEEDGSKVYTSEYGTVTIVIPKGQHAYGAWEITVKPTLDTTGTATRECECGDVDEVTLAALSDTSVWTVKTSTPSTCTVKGSTVYTSEYGEVTVELPLAPHTYGAWTITVKPTLDTTGTATRECECGDVDEVTLAVLSDTSVWTVKTSTPSTCTVKGSTVYTSEYGEVTVELPLAPHTYGAWTITVEPTLDTTGTATRECECGHVDTKTDVPALSDTAVWTPSVTEADYNNPTVTTYTSEYGTVVVTGNDKLVAPYDNKTYSSVYVQLDGKVNGTVSVGQSWNNALLTVNANGEASNTAHPWNGEGQFVMIDPETGKFEIHWNDDGELATTSGYVDMATGVFVFPYDTTYDYFHIAVPSDVAITSSLFKASVFNGAVAVQYVNGETICNIFVTGNTVYMGVTFVADDEGLTVDQLYAAKTLTVKDNKGNNIVTYVEDAEGNLVVADGLQGSYEGSLGTLTLSGSGLATLDNGGEIANGTYVKSETTVGLYINGKYYDVTLSGETYTAVATEVTLTFNTNGTTPDGEFTGSVSVNVNIEYKLPELTNATMQFKGWFYDAYCTQPVEEPFIPTASVELYALWAAKVEITLVGTLEGDETTLLLGEGDIIYDYLPEYTKNTINGNLYFAGWFLDAEFTLALSEDAFVTAGDSGFNIYAKWEDAFTMSGEYKGWNLMTSTGTTKKVSDMSYSATISPSGEFTASRLDAGTIDAQYKGLTDGALVMDGAYVYYNNELGILWYDWHTSSTGVGTDTIFYIKSEGVTSIDYSSKIFDGIFTVWMTVNFADSSVNVFLYNNRVYANVTWTDGVTAKQGYNTDNVIYDSNGDPIIANKGGQLTEPDGYQGTYTGTETDALVIDGIGNFTWGAKTGSYAKASTSDVFELYVKVDGANTEYWQVTLGEGTYTATKPEVTITFQLVGPEGVTEVMQSMTVNINIEATLPDGNEYNTAFVFNGYFTDLECENAVATPFIPSATSTVIYAKYSAPAVLTIVYNDGATENSVITYSVGDTVTVERPVYEKHMFVGWYTTAEFTEGTEWESGTAITEDTTIYAKWEVAPVYNADYGIIHVQSYDEVASNSKLYANGSVSFDPYGVAPSGSYPFNSSSKIDYVDELAGKITVTIGSSVYNAYIHPTTGIIIMNYRSGADTPMEEVFLLTPFESTGLSSKSVSSSYWGNGFGRAIQYTYDGTTYNILVKDSVVYFDVTFKSSNDFAAEDNNVAGVDCYTTTGLYIFDSEGALLEQPDTKITLDMNGHSENVTVTVNSGFVVNLAEYSPEAEGFIFRGWYTDSDFTTVAETQYIATATTTLYSKWDEQVTLTYKYLDGTTEDLVVTTYFANDSVTVQTVTFMYGELVFEGWYTLDGTTTGEWGDKFETGDSVTADTTLYAKWVEVYTMNGNYIGWNLHQETSDTREISDMSYETTIDVLGNFSESRLTDGQIDEQYKKVTDGALMLGAKYAYYNHSVGILWYPYGSNATGVGSDTSFLIKADNLQSIEYSGMKYSNSSKYVAWMTIHYADGSTRNVFLYNDTVYADVTWTDGITALTAKDNNVAVYNSEGEFIIAKTNGELVGLDGYQGAYTGTFNGDSEATEIVVDGAGVATIDGVQVSYTLSEGNMSFVLNNRMMTVALTLEGFTYQPVQDGLQGTYTLPDNAGTITLDGYGKAGDATYVLSGTTLTVYTAEGSTDYGIDVENKQLLGKSIFAGYVFTGTYVYGSGWYSEEYEYTITFDDSVEIKGTLKLSEAYGSTSYTFTATFDGSKLVMTLTSGSYSGDTIEATLSGNTLTINKDFGSYDYDMEGSTATCEDFGA